MLKVYGGKVRITCMAKVDANDQAWWLAMARKSGYKANLLVAELGISRRHLQRCTQRLFGRSPRLWLEQQRLSLAMDLLKEYRSVKVVAFRLGFKQPGHFSREFKRHHGVSPTEFLLQHVR